MKTLGTLKWNGEEGAVDLNANFQGAYYVLKIDALKDWIVELSREYRKLCAQEKRADVLAQLGHEAPANDEVER
jgi:hypothetical protein